VPLVANKSLTASRAEVKYLLGLQSSRLIEKHLRLLFVFGHNNHPIKYEAATSSEQRAAAAQHQPAISSLRSLT
jgi:hypothetical protein